MKIKETIYTETYDDRGRLIKRVRTTHVTDLGVEQQRHDRYERTGFGDCHRSSSKRIREAIEDYYMSDQW